MRKFIAIMGIVFVVLFFVLMIFSVAASFSVEPEETIGAGWAFMIYSLIAVIVAEVSFFIETVMDIKSEFTFGKIFRLLMIIGAAIVLNFCAYYGVLKTILCVIVMIAVTAIEIKGLFDS